MIARLDARRTIATVVVAAALAGCVGAPTSIELDLDYDDALALDEIAVSIGDREERTPAAHAVEIWVPDGWSGAEIQLDVRGTRAGQVVATGQTLVIPRLGEAVSASVALARVSCGAWCSPGSRQCDGDRVMVCEEGADGCAQLVEDTTCPMGCSLGECRDPCIDECAMGEVQCAGPQGLVRCGEGDSDSCLDWLPVEPCGDGRSCSAGQCVDGCAHECDTPGVAECRSGGRVTCGDLNGDGCREWGPVALCAAGASCAAGACVMGCTDECDKDVCDGDSERTCGQFDADPCLDLSAGVSCRRPGTCEVGSCGEDGCTTDPVVCETPPASTCVTSDMLRVYSPVGTCSAGACQYAYEDRSCPSCPACDACAGVTCDMPPPATCADFDTRRSFAAVGTCAMGSCSYAPTNEDCDTPPAATCVDGDTRRSFGMGRCTGGACNYPPIDEDCVSPPAPTCVNPTTRRVYSPSGTCATGSCQYTFTDTTCPSGCAAGACTATPCTPFGTDAFGYRGCQITMAPSALPCPDIRGTGTSAPIGDEAQVSVPIGFPFTFYGTSFSTLAIQSNGALTFTPDPDELDFINACFPTAIAHNPMIAALWDDIDPSQPGAGVRYQTRGATPSRTFQVQWNAPRYVSGGGGDPGWWSAILHEGSNRIDLCYHDVGFGTTGSDGSSATVGIQSATSALQFSCDMSRLSDGLYLELTPPP
ncbi:MAG: hypothetical protein AB7S26_20325 [Sandaracinaceae bacterium]